MADAIVRGEIDRRNNTEFRASVTCLRRGPSGSIRGEFEEVIGRREIDYVFSSNRPTRIVARRSGLTRVVNLTFRNVRVTNRNTNVTTSGGTLTLVARQNRAGRRTATLTIRRPGRRTLSVSGVLEDGVVRVLRQVSCRR